MRLFDRFRKPAAGEREAAVDVHRDVSRSMSSGPPPGYVSAYLSTELARELLVVDADGMPPLHLTRHDGELWLTENTTGRLVNVGNRQLRGIGVWSVRVRGEAHAATAVKVGQVDLVREPDNPHDRNAVAILQNGRHVGYVNKAMASGLAKLLDSGATLHARAISAQPPKVIAATPEIMAHLGRAN